MSVLWKKAALVKMSFQAPAELAARLKAVETAAEALGLDFDLDKQLCGALVKFLTAAERHLADEKTLTPGVVHPSKLHVQGDSNAPTQS